MQPVVERFMQPVVERFMQPVDKGFLEWGAEGPRCRKVYATHQPKHFQIFFLFGSFFFISVFLEEQERNGFLFGF
jgi:hypothetical protein